MNYYKRVKVERELLNFHNHSGEIENHIHLICPFCKQEMKTQYKGVKPKYCCACGRKLGREYLK